MTSPEGYVEIARKKQEKRANTIPAEWRLSETFQRPDNVLEVPSTCGILTVRELEITGQNDAVAIVRKIANKTYTAKEVTIAFCKRAAIAQQLVNCLTEIFFTEAIQRAEELDQEQAANPSKPLRPLHGLPISLKDLFRVPGHDSTIGFIAYANDPDTKKSALVQLLLDQGAVLYCKTNIPQTIMTADSDNNVFGRTVNPYNPKLTAGGSSGGEGALIAMRGSVLGVGTDVAGSIRIPAMACGVYGFRPSADIVPYRNLRSPEAPGATGITSVAGPLATTLRSCELFMKVVADAQPWRYDADCLHRPSWGQLVPRKSSIRVGLVSDDGVFTPWPPVRRAITEASNKLRAAGFDVVDLKLPDVGEATNVAWALYALDGAEHVRGVMQQGAEPPVESVKQIWGTGERAPATIQEYFQLRDARARFQEQFKQVWLDSGIDVILMPTAPIVAPPHDQWRSALDTALWNLLDYPAVAVPAGHVLESDHADGPETAIYGEHDKSYYALYTGPKDFKGAPISLQIVGMRQEDDALTAIAEQIDRTLSQ